jgi:lipoprotein-anchoring transpeptidase ErfK/SrfK
MKRNLQNQSTDSSRSSGLQNTVVKVTAIAAGILVVLLLAFIIGLRIYYSGRWYPNTWVGDQDISGMTFDESKELLSYVYENYQLDITGRDGGSLTITKSEIDYQVDLNQSLDEEFSAAHDSFPLFSLGEKKEIDVSVNATYNKDTLTDILKKSEIYAGSDSYTIVKPISAEVVFSKEKQYLVIQEEVNGNTLDFDAFYDAVAASLDDGYEVLDLTDEERCPNAYKQPEYVSTDASLQKKADACNAVALRWLTWKIDDNVSETVGPKRIYSWCKYKNGTVTFKKMAIRNWVEKLCLNYKTVGVTRTFKNHAGKKIKVTGGDYGWAFNYESMVKQLMKILKKSIDSELQQAYMEDPSKTNKKALTFTKTPKYSNTAYRYDYENKENDWDTKNFTEISLSDQMVYVWRKGKVAFTCKTISGRPVEDRETRKGAYFIKEHQPHRVLKGEDYETPVDYWVRIMWTGTGFHSAPWQSWSSWTNTYYQTRGSHGCLNLAPEDAKKIYNMTKYKEMVFIY